MEKIELKILGISYTHSNNSVYALILAETYGQRRLPIIIGVAEAQSIAIELEKMKAIRPLTHDLFKSFATSFNIYLKEVIINKFEDGIFHSLMLFSDSTEEKLIDARTSDAVALALRFNAPIYTYEEVMNVAGIILENDDKDIPDEPKKKETTAKKEPVKKSSTPLEDYSRLSIKELEELLNKAIEEEAFEKASRLRDEIKRRKK